MWSGVGLWNWIIAGRLWAVPLCFDVEFLLWSSRSG